MTPECLRMGGYQGPKSVHTRAAGIMAEVLAREAGVTLAFTADVTALGRPANDLFAMTEGDELDLCYFASSYLVGRVPELAVLDLPFATTSRERLYARLDGAPGRLLAGHVARRTGFTVLGWWDNGIRHFSNAVRPLRHPQDCRGLSIRTMNNAIHQRTFAALGFTPTFMDVKDFPQAIRARKVDAQENPLTNTLQFGVHETHRFVTLTGHFFGSTAVLANSARWSSWPGHVRNALGRAVATATITQRALAAEEDRAGLAALRHAGVEVLEEDAFDRAAFVAATRPVLEEAAREVDPAVLRAFAD